MGAITLFGGFIGGVGVLSLIGQFATQQMTSLSLEVAGGMSVVGLGAAATSATILRRTIFRPDPPASGELPPQDPDFYGC